MANAETAHTRATLGRSPRRTREIAVVAGGAAIVAGIVVLLSARATHHVNQVPMSASPRPVTVLPARDAQYQPTRRYVGAVEPWVEAAVGPQYISAYVETVTVRPGAIVRRGDVLATLDCSSPSAATRAVEMRARALDAQMRAARDEAARVTSMVDGGFVAINEVEQKTEASKAAHAELLATQANVLRSSLDVQDCVLRAPFDGEIGTRSFDPGAFVHPGASIVSVVDRDVVRVTVDAPEKDFDALAPPTAVDIEVLATGAHVSAPISRRAPRADPRTRTIHFEVDVPDTERVYPVDTTAVVTVKVGQPVAATEVPLYAATQEEGKARLFVVTEDVAHARTVPVVGEVGGALFVDRSALPSGTLVVTEGRELLSDGDHVSTRIDMLPDAGAPGVEGGAPARGGGYGRPL